MSIDAGHGFAVSRPVVRRPSVWRRALPIRTGPRFDAERRVACRPGRIAADSPRRILIPWGVLSKDGCINRYALEERNIRCSEESL